MKKDNFVKKIIAAIKDNDRNFSERVFIIFSLISELATILGLIGDIIFGEHIGEIIALSCVVVLVPTITFISLRHDRMRFAIKFIVASLVSAVLPALFFFGGGVEGGGIIWIIFAFMYVGLVLSGKWRSVILIVLVAMTVGCYYTEYYHPELVVRHTREVFYVDSFISVILVGFVCFFMTWSQNQLYKGENKRAREAAERAEELTISQNKFFSSMSHEIRTPINAILGLNELILRDESASDEIIRDANGISGAGKLLLALISDILDFSKAEVRSMEIVPVDYYVNDMISEIVNMIWLKANDKGLKFNVNIDPKVPTVLYGDEVRIKQIIINLLNNAVKYTAEGSVDLNIDSEEIDRDNTMLTISITDTGIGIRKETIPYLFDIFKRVDEEKNRYIEGTGLGLSIVKQLVELMNGTVTVNSVYGEGSTFIVTVKQGISDSTQIGEINIHNQYTAKRDKYKSIFKAPDARILIVDDNEMNLEVECKLLSETQLNMDKALSGREALNLTIRNRYDVILMDHLMPEMDGIECLEYIRSQMGGLNRTTPVIVLTANAGSDNRLLYNRAGFDAYLIKPVSGVMLEDMLMKHIPKDKLIISSKMLRMREDINTSAGYARKTPIIITTTSMSDLPDYVIKKLNIPIIPFNIRTDDGVFKDGIQMDANELIRYINAGRNATSSPPDVKAYTDFFASNMKKAHHLIHIAITSSMSDEYKIAAEAAKSFDNVTVINSECVTSATGILVLIAYRLAQQNIQVEDIIEELEMLKQRLRCSFVMDTTEFMARKGLISSSVNNIAGSLNLRPWLKFKDDRFSIGGVFMGSTRSVYRQYIRKAFPVDIIPDSEVVFITYADVPMDTLLWIKEEISKLAYFENVVFQQASAAISSNCGSGAFGIFYFVKSNKSYNIGAFVEHDNKEMIEEFKSTVSEKTIDDKMHKESDGDTDKNDHAVEEADDNKWYQKLDFIDVDSAIENCGTENVFYDVLKIFYNSISARTKELENFYLSNDWNNFTIKIHALKSSAKLIGALELSERARLLEKASKEGNVDYIKEQYDPFMKDYTKLGKLLNKAVFDEKEENDSDKPLADNALIDNVLDKIREGAETMDYDLIEESLDELSNYSIPDDNKAIVEAVIEKADMFDYEGILEVLK